MGPLNRVTGGEVNRLLGFPADACLLIINKDDLGMCHAVNEASFIALQSGLACSATLMPPCPWALHAAQFLNTHPELPFGIHLTVISDFLNYRWGTIQPEGKSPFIGRK